jgi:RHS repeat-associated protein
MDVGFKPYGSYHGGDLDSINLSNGFLNIHIPVASFPQRGAIGYTPQIIYNNHKGWSVLPDCTNQNTCSPLWQWKGSGVTLNLQSEDFFTAGPGPYTQKSKIIVFRAVTSDVATHQMATNLAGGAESIDGIGIWYNGTAFGSPGGFSRNRNGVLNNNTAFEDANGNIFGTPSGANIIDTLGRSLPTPASFTATTDFSGCTGPLPTDSASIFSFPGYAGATSYVKLCHTTIQLQSNFQASGYYNDLLFPITEAQTSSSMLQSVVLYNGSSWANSLAWTFEYSSRASGDSPSVNYGDLTKITLPTGGTISYTWANIPTCDPNDPVPFTRGVATRTVNANDGSAPHTWTYSNGTVTDPAGNDTVHTFTGLNASCSLYETQTQYFQGPQSSGSLLKTVKTDYRWMANPFDSLDDTETTPTVTNVFPIRTTTTWPSGKITKVEKDYDSQLVFSVPGRGQFTGSYGNLLETREYDYGDGATWTLLRRTDYAYKAFDGSLGSSSYLALNRIDLVSSITTYDGSGNQVAQTTYGYDESALQPSSVTTQHDSAPLNGSLRGNRTSESHWLNTTGATLTSTVSYYDTGTPYQATDPGGHTSTNFYASGFQTGSAFAGAYVTQTQNALLQNAYFDYDFSTGSRTATKDANGAVSTADYDLYGRTLHHNAPDGGITTWNYTDSQPPSFTVTSPIDGVISRKSEGDLDGLGRTMHSKLLSDPDGADTVDTTYDGLGRVATVSNPHRGPSSSTDGITTSIYDALGRVTQVILQDGSVSTTDYSQFPSVTVTDPAGNQRTSRTDALGRLVEVDEPGSHLVPAQPGSPATSGSGSITIPGTEQSQQVQTVAGTKSSATVTITGSAKQMQAPDCPLHQSCPIYDSGSVAITVNGVSASASYTGPLTSAGMASGLASAINTTPGMPVTATVSSSTVTLQSVGTGAAVNYGFSLSTSYDTTDFTSPSFSFTPASGTMTGGTNAQYTTSYDSGRTSVILNGTTYSTTWGQGSTASSIATALAASMNGTLVSATANGGVISIVANAQGASTNYTLSVSSSSTLGSFSAAASGSALGGGADAVAAVPMHTVWSGLALTLYKYDALGNLYCVEQHGDAATGTACPVTPPRPADAPVQPDPNNAWRRRLFAYDSLSRLRWASNPESGVIAYSYDADGNLLQKTSPAPNQTVTATQTVSYCYDALHRVTGKGYGAQSCPLAAPVVTYAYDSGTNAQGHLTSLTDQAGTGNYTYNIMGQIDTETRVLYGANNAAISKTLSYAYNLDASFKTLTYPDGSVLTYTPSGAGRMISAVDRSSSSIIINYVTGASYGPDGSITSFISGNSGTFAGITNAFTYNKRLQPVNMSANAPGQTVFSIGYDFHVGNGTTGADNGNVFGITNYKDNTRNQTFTYDLLNRLASAQNTGTTCAAVVLQNKSEYWGNSYIYDAWGNLLQKTVTKCGAENLSVTADGHNWIHATGGSDYLYDAAGNMTFNATPPTQTYTYDQENRLTGAAGYAYTYDADGNRVAKSNGSTGTLYWYMTPGIVGESDLSGNLTDEYVFFDGERVARKSTNGVFYYFSDHLKTASVITDSAGVIKAESDYYPWGGELQFVNNDSNHYKFTGKERDGETQLDYFGARYYSNGLGRWVSADWSPTPIPVPYADFGDPQTLNLFGFVGGNPASKADPDGHQQASTAVQVIEITPEDIALINAIGETVPPALPIVTLGASPVAATVFAATHPLAPPEDGCSGPYCDMFMWSGSPAQNQGQSKGQTKTEEPEPAAAPAPAAGGAGKGPVKAKDAPGVTAGGQATNNHGQKLAPSGRPQVNNVNKNTREKARNAANKGSGTIHDRKTRRGRSHFHTKRGTGDKKRDGTHYNYPG